ncbi:ATP-dependent DNA ligase [Prosthecomicrobium sp. N25]|uniref:ATP-dependent DNA ligase n=1 Tax=Prosthecomicrobium sp. N25 TaxID=3129254 RepID=UPI00307707CE
MALPVGSAVLDGEGVVLRPGGYSDFDALRSKDGGRRAVMVTWDLLELDGIDFRRMPLEHRRECLRDIVGGAAPGLLFSESLDAEGPEVFEHACRLGLEGIVSKKRGSVYRSGSVRTWMKTKHRAFVRS